MKKFKILISVMVMLFCITTTKGQDSLKIHLVDNSDMIVALDDIQRMTFNNNNMLLKPVSGVEQSYLLDNIAVITFLNTPDDPDGIGEFSKNIEVNVYLNSSGEVVAESSYPITGLTLFDLHGRVVNTTNLSHVNVISLSKGVYLLKIETSAGTVTKKFVKTR